MTTFTVHLSFDKFRFRANLVESTANIYVEGCNEGEYVVTPYRTADARHCQHNAARLALQYAGREYYASPDDQRESDEILDDLLDDVEIEREDDEDHS